MSGETPQHEGKDFVAPDEAQPITNKITDQDKAYAMARHSDALRTPAAEQRKVVRESAELHGKTPEEAKQEALNDARANDLDADAEIRENIAGAVYDKGKKEGFDYDPGKAQ